jgi:hypothetical protein
MDVLFLKKSLTWENVLPTQKRLIITYQILKTDTYFSYINLTYHFMYIIS